MSATVIAARVGWSRSSPNGLGLGAKLRCDRTDRFSRHSSLGMLSPIEDELRHADNLARDRAS
jgi:hypothetical protein